MRKKLILTRRFVPCRTFPPLSSVLQNYDPAKPADPPGGAFAVPPISSADLLALRCAPALKPYLSSDLDDANLARSAGIVVDAHITRVQEAGAKPVPTSLPQLQRFVNVVLRVDGENVAVAVVPLGRVAVIPFSLKKLDPSSKPKRLECLGTILGSAESYAHTSTLLYLPPNPFGGSTARLDARTGALVVKGSTSETWEPIWPFGMYTSFDGFLAKDLTVLDDIKARGMNTVHPVPTFGNLTALELVLDRMEELGLWLMYDMRW